MLNRLSAAALSLLALWSALAQAEDGAALRGLMDPFAARNYNPFVHVYGIPAMAAASARGHGESSLALTLDVTSHFSDGRSDSEFLSVDGETYRLELRYERGVGNGWQLGAALPLVAHDGGLLDGFINDWHDFFDLPSLGRTRVADDQLQFVYERDGVTQVLVDDDVGGIGDLIVFAGKELSHARASAGTRLMAHAQLKLPTGDSDELLGSGAADGAVSLQAAGRWHPRLHWHAAAALTYLGSGDVLPELQRHWVVSGALAMGWQALSRLAFKLQFDGQSSVYENTQLNELDSSAFQITIGGSARITRRWLFDFGVVENAPNGDVSPDVSFHIRLRSM